MWWFILCVHFTRERNAQIVVAHYFWIHLWRYFWKRSAFKSVAWVKKMCPHQRGWASSSPLRAWIKQTNKKRQRKENCLSPLGLRWPSSSAFRHWSSWFSDLWTWNLTPVASQFFQTESHNQLSWFSTLQKADCGTSWPPSPYIRLMQK